MRDIAAALLREEISRLGALLCDTDVYHPSGVRLHGFGDAIGLEHAKRIYSLGMHTLFVLDPGEDVKTAVAALLPDETLPAYMVAGDIPAQDVRAEDGTLLAPGGAPVTADVLALLRARLPRTAILRVRDESYAKPPQTYLKETGADVPDPTRPDTRVLRAARQRSREIWTYFVPRARVLVALAGDFDRSLASNTLRGAGHEVLEGNAGREGVELCREAKPDVVLVDLAEAEAFAFALRAALPRLDPIVFVLTPDPKTPEIGRALEAGANAVIQKPLVPDALVERIRSALLLLGRSFRYPPLVLKNRRSVERRAMQAEITLRSVGSGASSLPLSAAAVKEWGPSGALIDYNRPKKTLPWAYMPHGVHPGHFWHRHAVRTPGAVPLEVVVTTARKSVIGSLARVAWVRPTIDGECAGLVLSPKQGPGARDPGPG